MNRRRLLPGCLILVCGMSQLQAGTPLPKDPRNVHGRFENGFSYIIRPHDNPPGRVVLRLHVRTGALNETDSQNGLAHFLEHMAFNGSKHFAPGKLIPYMNKLGMQFGADSNANTSYRHTVYYLDMPDVKPETIDKAMTIFADYANGLLLKPEEIEKERQVILEEVRSRGSAALRIQRQWMKHVFEGTRIAVHDVLGDEKQIEEFPREEFEQYWNTWYRPKNMTLIVVGEIKPDEIIEAARKHFANFKPRGKSRKRQRSGIHPVDIARAVILTDPEQVMCQLQMVSIQAARPPMKTYEDYRFNEVENFGTSIVSRRLQEMVDKGTAHFRGAGLIVQGMEEDSILPVGGAVGEPGDWNKMLDQLVTEISRAIDHGFNERELDLAKKELLAGAESAAQAESTWPAQGIAQILSASVGDHLPMLSAQQRLDLVRQIVSEASLEEVHNVFTSNFKTAAYTYTLAVPQEKDGFSPPSSDDVLAAAKAAWARRTETVHEESTTDSLLAEMPTPGEIVSENTDDDLEVTTFTLANGTIAHHRYTDYKKAQVMVSIVLPGGDIEETAANRGVSYVAQLAFSTPASHRLNATQIRDFMADKKIGVRGAIGIDAVRINIEGLSSDADTGFQLAHAIITDGKIEQSAFDNWKKQTLQGLEKRKTDVNGQLGDAMEETVFASDVRLCHLNKAQIERLSVAEGQKCLERLLAHSAIEATVVGDISLDEAKKLIAKYLGSLPNRSGAFRDLDTLRTFSRDSGPYARTARFRSITDKALVLAGCVGCDERDIVDLRLLNMAALIISDRMTRRIREEEQLVYGIRCQSQPGREIRGLGMFFAVAPTDPQKAEKLADTIIAMIQEFAQKGPTSEELDVARKQMANELDTQMKEPYFWISQLSEINYRNRPLAELKELPGVYQTFTAKQIQGVVKKYMKEDRVIRLVAIPESKDMKSPDKNKPKRSGKKNRSKALQP